MTPERVAHRKLVKKQLEEMLVTQAIEKDMEQAEKTPTMNPQAPEFMAPEVKGEGAAKVSIERDVKAE